MGAKLSFAFTSVTDEVVNPQFSTFLISTCQSYFAPIINTWLDPCEVLSYAQESRCIYSHVLMVEAPGTAPGSSLPFNQHQQTVFYLYHEINYFVNLFFKSFSWNFLASSPATHAPWKKDSEFLNYYNLIKKFTLLDPPRAYTLWQCSRNVKNYDGLILDIGCLLAFGPSDTHDGLCDVRWLLLGV